MPFIRSGSKYDDDFKKKFALNTIKTTKDLGPNETNELIRHLAHKINVHVYELKSWIAAFIIVFQVEKAIGTNELDNSEIMERIKHEVIKYMSENRDEKKYKVVKIVTQVFKNFGITESKASLWLNQLVQENHKRLKGLRLDQYGLTGPKTNGSDSSDNSGS